jgi:hypothetical protein
MHRKTYFIAASENLIQIFALTAVLSDLGGKLTQTLVSRTPL